MEYLEKNKFIHRDLRSANVLVGVRDDVKIADFGLAKIIDITYVGTERKLYIIMCIILHSKIWYILYSACAKRIRY